MRNPGNLNPQKEKYPVKKDEYPHMPGLRRVTRRASPENKNNNFSEYDRQPIQQIPESFGETYPVPAFALGIILVNMAIWAFFMLLYWLSTAPMLQAIGAFFILVLAMALYLAIQYILWRFFWWLFALSACITTLGLFYLILTLFTGATTLNSLGLPRF